MILRRSGDHVVGAVVALLLILTAWGNAYAMMIASGLALVASLVLFRGRIGRGVPFVILASAAVAAVIAVVILATRK
ncbi:MAG TPA: hypothetical protein VMU02_10490 [bacterium]|nr:hypothetical protein [bacterium]